MIKLITNSSGEVTLLLPTFDPSSPYLYVSFSSYISPRSNSFIPSVISFISDHFPIPTSTSISYHHRSMSSILMIPAFIQP